MPKHDRGFTLIELIAVIMVGIVLAGIAMQSFQGVQGRAAARQARQVFATLHARSRAHAIERGQIVRLYVDKDADTVAITRSGTVVETVRFSGDLGVDIQGTGALTLCMSPRGYAETACNSFTSTQTLVFAAGGDTASVQMLTMGQIR